MANYKSDAEREARNYLRELQLRAATNLPLDERAVFEQLDEVAAYVLSREEMDAALWQEVGRRLDEEIDAQLGGQT
jgi:hypothetical protein